MFPYLWGGKKTLRAEDKHLIQKNVLQHQQLVICLELLSLLLCFSSAFSFPHPEKLLEGFFVSE